MRLFLIGVVVVAALAELTEEPLCDLAEAEKAIVELHDDLDDDDDGTISTKGIFFSVLGDLTPCGFSCQFTTFE